MTITMTKEHLAWDIMKFCKGFKPHEIEVCTYREGEHKQTHLVHWEGKSKSEKIKTLSDVIGANYFEDIDIILPTCESYTF